MRGISIEECAINLAQYRKYIYNLKFEELIIKPKDKLIEKLYEENCYLHHKLYK